MKMKLMLNWKKIKKAPIQIVRTSLLINQRSVLRYPVMHPRKSYLRNLKNFQ